MFKTEPPNHCCTVTTEDYFFLSDRIKVLENKLSQVYLEESKPALVFPKLNTAKLKPRQSPQIQVFSVYKVFGTTELLEIIPLHLSERDLLLCQRVDKTFRATVQQSIKIKKILFFIPSDGRHLDGGPIFNPLFTHKDSKLVANIRGVNFMYSFPMETPRSGVIKFDVERPTQYHIDSRILWLSIEGSWKDMYITRLLWDINVELEGTKKRKRIKGTTLGKVLENLCEEYHLG
jgi:hypothetical protein